MQRITVFLERGTNSDTHYHFSKGAPVVEGTRSLAASRAATSSSLIRHPNPPEQPKPCPDERQLSDPDAQSVHAVACTAS